VLCVGSAAAVTADQNLPIARQRLTDHLTGFFNIDKTGPLKCFNSFEVFLKGLRQKFHVRNLPQFYTDAHRESV
jgi:hypothetical protein